MATVTDNLTYLSSYQPFEKPPDSSTLYSLIPRGVRRFFFANDTSAKPINDTIVHFLTATLPVNFAFIMRSFNWHLTADTVGNYDEELALRMSNHIPGQPLGTLETIMTTQPLQLIAGATSQRAGTSQLDLKNFTSPMWAVHGGSITFRASTSNTNATAQAAGFLISHCEFYEYDLSQAQRYFINTPQPVLAR